MPAVSNTPPQLRPDDEPVGEGAIGAFLDWYRKRTDVPDYEWLPMLWLHALRTLRIAELRAGMREYDRELRGRYIGPVAFWHLCRDGKIPERHWRRHVHKYGRRKDVDPNA